MPCQQISSLSLVMEISISFRQIASWWWLPSLFLKRGVSFELTFWYQIFVISDYIFKALIIKLIINFLHQFAYLNLHLLTYLPHFILSFILFLIPTPPTRPPPSFPHLPLRPLPLQVT
jgi:hypothetical protein